MAGLSSFFNWYHDNGILPNLWKGATGQLSQEKMNTENIDYQKERNKIEDSRYEEETAYNRAFAEDQRDYERSRDALSDTRYADETAYNRAFAENERNYQRSFAAEEQQYNRAFAEEKRDYDRALQQQIFEREDTALERQAQSLAKLGINPLSQNMSGLGAGSVVSSGSAPGSSAGSSVSVPSAGNQSHSSGQQAPALSGRGGKALQNMAIQSHGIIEALAPINEMVNSISNLNQQGVQRDVLREQQNLYALQSERVRLENAEFMAKHGIRYSDDGSLVIDPYNHTSRDFSDVDYRDKNASANRNERVDVFQEDYNVNDMSTDKERLATGIVSQLATGVVNDAVTGTLDAVDKTLNDNKVVRGAVAGASALAKSKFDRSPIGKAYNLLIKPRVDAARKRKEERKKNKE